jgi:hypothetical protein
MDIRDLVPWGRERGVLTVTLPKAPSAQRPVHRIEVTSG